MIRRLLFTILIGAAFVGVANSQTGISGRLFKSNGKPLPYTEVELVESGAETVSNDQRLLAVSGTDGRFRFRDVPHGSYTLSINFNESPTDLSPYPTYFFPAATDRREAKYFEFSGHERFDNLAFKLPPAFEMCTINGRVEFADGTPAAGALMGLRDVIASKGTMGFGSTRANAAGIFKFRAFIGRQYQVGALAVDPAAILSAQFFDPLMFRGAAESEIFTPDKTFAPLRLIVRESKEMQRIRERYEARNDTADVRSRGE